MGLKSWRVFVFFVGLSSFTLQIEGHWMDRLTESMTQKAHHFVREGNQVVTTLQSELEERQTDLKEVQWSDSTGLGIDFVACANISSEYVQGKTLLADGKQLYRNIEEELRQITDCFSNMSRYGCWSVIIEKLPDLLEKYKPLTSCYINNVYYTIEMMEYFIDSCLGSPPATMPHPPPETYDECTEQIK